MLEQDQLSTRLLGIDLVEHIDNSLPEEYDIEVTEDKRAIVISLPENDEVVGVLRYTNEREKGGNGGPDFLLKTVFAGNQEDVTTTWFNVDEALKFVMGQCNFAD